MDYPDSALGPSSRPWFDCTVRKAGLANLCRALQIIEAHTLIVPPKRPPSYDARSIHEDHYTDGKSGTE